MAIERLSKAQKGAKAEFLQGDPSLAETHPTLWEYCCRQRWSDGADRETATLLIFARDGGWSACLNDRANQRGLWVTAATVAGLLDALESCLCREGGEWRPYRENAKRR